MPIFLKPVQISALSLAAKLLPLFPLRSLQTAGQQAEFGVLLSDVYTTGALDRNNLRQRAGDIVHEVNKGNWIGVQRFRDSLVEECNGKLCNAIPPLLDSFSAEQDPMNLALLKEEIIRSLWEADRTLILYRLREAMTSAPGSPLATNAVLFASWFRADMPKAARRLWPDRGNRAASAITLRTNLLLLLKEIGFPSWATLENLKEYDPCFGPNLDRILSAISKTSMKPRHEIRAQFDAETVTVYQAFSEDIGQAALANQFLNVPGFKQTRTTWIKPSFPWILYRSGYGMKEAGQARILAIHLRRGVFEQLLREEENRVVQWDPERTVDGASLPWRTIQIGIRPEAVRKYLEGIVKITDMTQAAHTVYRLVRAGKTSEAEALLPEEKPYPTAPRG